MCRECPDVPTVTRWRVQITHGSDDTVDGLVFGWGWLCYECHPARGEHGFPTPGEVLTALGDHVGECAGHG